MFYFNKQDQSLPNRHLEIMPVTLSAAKGLAHRTKRSLAALRMTGRTPLKSAHGKPSLQTSRESDYCLTGMINCCGGGVTQWQSTDLLSRESWVRLPPPS